MTGCEGSLHIVIEACRRKTAAVTASAGGVARISVLHSFFVPNTVHLPVLLQTAGDMNNEIRMESDHAALNLEKELNGWISWNLSEHTAILRSFFYIISLGLV